MMKLRLLFFVILLSFCANSQEKSTVFSFEEYLLIVKNHHPISFQANLRTLKGEAKIKKAKGGFDPKLEGEMYQKYFDGKQYYSYLNSSLKIPTWFGITIQSGYGNTDGTFLNSESNTPNDGLWFAGLSLNLGKGLVIDKRRAELKQAKIYVNSTLMEQKLMLNQLIYDASTSYWKWFKAYNKVEVYESAVTNSESRLENVRQNVKYGVKAEIDTLKALIQLQNMQLKLEQAELELANKKELLETFLWQDGFVPLELDSVLKPKLYLSITPSYPKPISGVDIDSLVEGHPELIFYQYKIDIIKIDYRLKKENLKPTIQLKYNTLSSPTKQKFFGEYSLNNYYWGAQVSYPVFTRKERGDLLLSEIKLKEEKSQLLNKKALIKYKLVSAYNTWMSTVSQFDIYSKTLLNYNSLFNSELVLFDIGESSLFLINFRQQEMINAQIKIIDLLYNNYTSEANWKYQTVLN